MVYQVELTNRAARDLGLLYEEKHAAESSGAARWLNGLEQALDSLADHPRRCPLAPESKNLKRQLRNLLYGNRPHIYRIIYEIDDRRRIVWVLHIRHGARRQSKAPDLT